MFQHSICFRFPNKMTLQKNIATKDNIKNGSFSEAINSIGLERLFEVFEKISQNVAGILPDLHTELGNLATVAIHGSLINATLSNDEAIYNTKRVRKS